MGNKLFVGNISWGATQEDLENLFGQAGTLVEVKLVMDRENPSRHRGFAFVTMGTEEEAQKAIEMFNGHEVDGREINVSVAKPQKPREDRSF